MDAILYWNDVALEANRLSHTHNQDQGTLGPTQSSRTLAIIHLAMYDACAGASGNPADLAAYDRTSPLPADNTQKWPAGAISGAAFATISVLYPDVSARPDFDLAAKKMMASVLFPSADWDKSFTYGESVGHHRLTDRSADPNSSDANYVTLPPPTGRGDHRPDPDNSQGYHGPFYGSRSRCFAVTQRHALDAPPQPGTAEYEKYLVQVRGKGIAPELMGSIGAPYTKRTNDETIIGIYWGYDGAKELGTPPRLYNQIIRKVAIAKNNTLAQNARLFAMVNVAMGDAGILAWEQKYIHNLWRPVVGIREHDTSLGLDTTPGSNPSNHADINWLPLGAPKSNVTGKNFTPPFPAYPSGHATFGAAAFHIARLFYGVTSKGPDNLFNGLSFVSDELNNHTTDNKGTIRPRHERSFPGGLWQMIEENGFSRVYLGVHWAFDAFALDNNNNADLSQNIGGVPLGLAIAEDIYAAGNGLEKSAVLPVVTV